MSEHSTDPSTGLPHEADIDGCRRCDLWRHATQGVPGEGPRRARLMLVGEQPGDEEDQKGAAFVGPAGRLLDTLLDEAGIDRSQVYVTNAVKHFKWEPRGKRRLHKRPNVGEISACNPWLSREISGVRPTIIVALGATAARAVIGKDLSIASARRDLFMHPGGAKVIVTYHPSAVLRANYGGDDDALRGALVDDLSAARVLLEREGAA